MSIQGPNQKDLFLPAERSLIEEMRRKRLELLKELEEIDAYTQEIAFKKSCIEISKNLMMTPIGGGYVAFVRRRAPAYSSRQGYVPDAVKFEIEVLGSIEIDKLSKAVQQLVQETHNDAERIPGSDGSQSTDTPW